MASAASKTNVKKTLSLEEMVHGILESDEDESLSEFIDHIEHSEHLSQLLILVFLLFFILYRLNVNNLRSSFDFLHFWVIFLKNA